MKPSTNFYTANLVKLLAATLVFIIAANINQTTAAQEPSETQAAAAYSRLPLDPLTTEEKAEAERIARTDPRVREIVAEPGVRLISAEVAAYKSRYAKPGEIAGRFVEVILFGPEREAGARVLVNLARKNVEDVRRVPALEVPMNDDDLKQAFELAIRDAQVQKALGEQARSFRPQITSPESQTLEAPENAVTGLPVRGTRKGDPCMRHRCMQLFFRRGRDFLSEPVVVVDLTAKQVRIEKPHKEGK